MEEVKMGILTAAWKNKKKIKYITFSVTDECNLRCTYCYFTHKDKTHIMSFDIAKKAIDNILTDERMLIYDGVVWDFIGGEPTLEIDLIDRICDYLLYKMYVLGHKWFYCYRIMIGTNGLLYGSEKFQKFYLKHGVNIHVNITIDGTKEKHDLSRKKIDGSGSYDDVVRNIPLWLQQTKNTTTKATFSHSDLPYLKDSIIHLWNLGLTDVMANVVFENIWHENDDLIFEKQLIELADYILENRLWDKYSVKFFDQNLGMPTSDQNLSKNFCGTGNMLTINYQGNYYPCVRFMDSALNNKSGRIIGNVDNGVDSDKVRAFNALSGYAQSSNECIECSISSGCCWCSGLNYDDAETATIFERQTHQCLMHKANVRAATYFWNEYEHITGKMSPRRYNEYMNVSPFHRFLYIICNSKVKNICCYNDNSKEETISEDIINKAVNYCEINHITPIFVGAEEIGKYFGFYIDNVESFKECNIDNDFCIGVLNTSDITNGKITNKLKNLILPFSISDIDNITQNFSNLINNNKNLEKVSLMFDYNIKPNSSTDFLLKYKDALFEITDVVYSAWSNGRYIQVNVITDELFLKKLLYCKAGKYEFTLGPNGSFYLCPAFYFGGSDETIGDITTGITNPLPQVIDLEKSILCSDCSSKHCKRCIYQNMLRTNEFVVPSELQCAMSKLESKASYYLVKKVLENEIDLPFQFNKRLKDINNFDPLTEIRGNEIFSMGLNEILKEVFKNG